MSNLNNNDSVPVSKVVELSAFKKKRDTKEELARSRRPLFVNHSEGTVSGRPSNQKNASAAEGGDFADRLVKIRGSLDRINQLMAEIKKLSAKNSN